MLKEKETVIRKAMILLDGLVVCGAFLLSYYLGRYFHVFYKESSLPFADIVNYLPSSIEQYIIILLFAMLLWPAMLYINGAYKAIRTESFFAMVWTVAKSAVYMVFAFGSLIFFLQFKFVSRLFFINFILISAFLIIIEKIIVFYVVKNARKKGHNFKRFLIVGTGKRADSFIAKINNHPEWGFKIEGVIDYEKHPAGKNIKGIEIIGTLDNLQDILCDKAIDEVVFLVPRSALGKIENALYVCENLGIRATLAIDLFDFKLARFHQTELDGTPLLSFETTVADELRLFIKRGIDIMASLIGLIILSPVFLITALLIKLTSTGPVFFLQKRAGLNGREFVLYKFRTMYNDADKKRGQMESLNEMDGPVFKIKNDPRITPAGKMLRKLSIDELPQLLNVLIGNMSLVGPRPLPVYEVGKFEPWQRRRLSMRPGITCLWQVSGRNRIQSFDDWMKLDLDYIDKWHLRLDFFILFKTIPVVLFGVGAY
ncbi:MAG: sugar transferase [Candidatus Omnitrophica bacterium]|nr:sugar transferase [Candidatus Omnitrophota bacterium]